MRRCGDKSVVRKVTKGTRGTAGTRLHGERFNSKLLPTGWLTGWLTSFNYHCWALTLKSASEDYFSSVLQTQLSEFFFSFSPCPPALFTVLRLEPTVNRLPLAVTPPVKSLCSVPAEGSVGEATSYHHLY